MRTGLIVALIAAAILVAPNDTAHLVSHLFHGCAHIIHSMHLH